MEAPTLFKRKGKYYLIASGCTGWLPNEARSAIADNIFGPWTEHRDVRSMEAMGPARLALHLVAHRFRERRPHRRQAANKPCGLGARELSSRHCMRAVAPAHEPILKGAES
jgi:hypothetical protein